MIKLPNYLGDIVMATPALAVARAACPEARLSVLVRAPLAPVLRLVPWVDEAVAHSAGLGLDPRRHLEMISRLARRREQKIVLLTRSLESALWAALARIPERCGQPAEGRSPLLTRRLPATDLAVDERHHFEQITRDAFGFERPMNRPRLVVDSSLRASLRQRLAAIRHLPDLPLVGIGPSSGGADKRWPAERFSRVIAEIHRRRIGECLLIGAPAERSLLEAVAGAAGAPAPRVLSDLGIPELAALLLLCDVYCGNDSGPTHLASELGVPTLAIYFATDPRRTSHPGEHVTVVGPAWDLPPAPRRAPTLWSARRRRRFARRRAAALAPETVVAAIVGIITGADRRRGLESS